MRFHYTDEDTFASFEKIKRTKPRKSDLNQTNDPKRDKRKDQDYSKQREFKRGENDL